MFGKRERPTEKLLSIPDFTALTGQAVGTLVESNEVTVTADNAWVFSALIRGGDAEFNVNGTGWVKNAAFRNGDTIKLRATTSGDPLTETVINLYAQSANKEWSITTSEITDWTPAELFTAGEQGVWYDPSDLTTMFQDPFGSTPVTAAGQTVALMLDKSQGLTQGEATTATGWVNAGFGSFSTDGTSVTFEKTVSGGTDQTYSSAQFAVTAGTLYEIELDVSQYFGSFQVFFSFATNSRGWGFEVLSGGIQKFFLMPSATSTLSLNFRTVYVGGGASVSVASVREAPLGNHALQETAASRPVYQTDGTLYWLEFDGAGDHMFASYGSTFSELTRAFAYRSNDQAFIGDDNDTVNEGSVVAIEDGDLRFGVSGSGAGNNIVAVGGWNWGINSVAVASVSSTKELRLTGSGNDAIPATSTSGITSLSGITIGAAAGGLISLDGRIYNVIDVDRVVTTQERDILTAYLAQKSGVTL